MSLTGRAALVAMKAVRGFQEVVSLTGRAALIPVEAVKRSVSRVILNEAEAFIDVEGKQARKWKKEVLLRY